MLTATNTSGPRERLLEAASRLFYQQGYHATGVNQLIDEAGVAKASFYDHFDSKQALAETYLAEGHRRWREMLDTHLARYDDPRARLVPYTVFIDPQLGRVGLSEEQARGEGRDVRVAKLPMTRVARARETDETRGFMKAVVDPDTGQILGVTILGPEGGEIMSALQLAMMGGVTYTEIRETAFAHPTLTESLNNLFAALED